MDYSHLYSKMVSRVKASAIRELLKIISKPEVISFAGGLPDPRLFPKQEIADIMHDVVTHSTYEALQYGTTEGQAGFKKELAKLLKETEDIDAKEENLLVVSASQQGLDMVARIFINPGDSIVTAAPTYLGALQAFQAADAHVVGAASDEFGVTAEGVEKSLAQIKAAGKICKFVYLVPDFQNPTGTTIPEERRIQILEIAKRYGTIIIEDSPYRQVRFEGVSPKTFYKLDNGQGNVLALYTFSKVFVPGFRLGYMVGDAALLQKFIVLKQSMDLCTSPILQLATAEYLRRGLLLPHVQEIVQVYHEKRDLMLKTLTEYMPQGVTWTRPEGGLFLWLTVPKQIDTQKLLAEALKRNVAYVSGVDFYPQADVHNDMRLNFSYSTKEQLVEGLKRLAATIKEAM